MEIRLRTLIPLIRPGSVYSGSASLDDCGRLFPDKLRVSTFSGRFPHYACGIVSPLPLRWVKGVCVFRCNLPPALSAEWPVVVFFFVCVPLNTSQLTKLTLEKKILPLLLRGFELETFRRRGMNGRTFPQNPRKQGKKPPPPPVSLCCKLVSKYICQLKKRWNVKMDICLSWSDLTNLCLLLIMLCPELWASIFLVLWWLA